MSRSNSGLGISVCDVSEFRRLFGGPAASQKTTGKKLKFKAALRPSDKQRLTRRAVS